VLGGKSRFANGRQPVSTTDPIALALRLAAIFEGLGIPCVVVQGDRLDWDDLQRTADAADLRDLLERARSEATGRD
jgi:hypothetical protein